MFKILNLNNNDQFSLSIWKLFWSSGDQQQREWGGYCLQVCPYAVPCVHGHQCCAKIVIWAFLQKGVGLRQFRDSSSIRRIREWRVCQRLMVTTSSLCLWRTWKRWRRRKPGKFQQHQHQHLVRWLKSVSVHEDCTMRFQHTAEALSRKKVEKRWWLL